MLAELIVVSCSNPDLVRRQGRRMMPCRVQGSPDELFLAPSCFRVHPLVADIQHWTEASIPAQMRR